MDPIRYRCPTLVAEIGCNHTGRIELAKELIGLARLAGVRHVKFQKRTVRELLTPEQYAAPHPNPHHAFGPTYGAHREFLELDVDQHRELRDFCSASGMEYASSVWDATAAAEIASLEPSWIKVPSACNNDLELLRVLRDDWHGPVHLSLGMTTRAEEEAAVALFEATGAARERLVLYACTSGYPVAFEDVCLLEIVRLRETWGNRVHAIGFSGHHLGIAVDIAAYALGAEWIERHFTKDRTLKGTDHAASLEPAGLSKLQRDLSATWSAMRAKPAEILPVEHEQRHKLKRRLGSGSAVR
jgi:N-acetylneuraminate synthase